MASSTVARRYARAFVELAEEADVVDRLAGDLDGFLAVVQHGDGEAYSALCNPVFTVAERKSVLGTILERFDLHPLSRNLTLLLLDKGRFSELPHIVEQYRTYADEHAGRVRVFVETAEPMSPQLETEVRHALEKVSGLEVLLDTRVKPDLIGGLIARVGGKVYDASVRARLEDIKQRLLSTRSPAVA